MRTLLNLLCLLLLGPEHRWCEDPLESALFIIIRAQASKAQGPIDFLRILIFFIFLGPKPVRRRALLFSKGLLFLFYLFSFCSLRNQPIATKLGEHDLKTLGTQNCQDIFDISNGLPVARR